MVFWITFELAKHQILAIVIKEFLSRGLDKTYAEDIALWLQYIDQKKFAVKLDKQMKEEIEKFRGSLTSWSPTELKEFVIEGLNLKTE